MTQVTNQSQSFPCSLQAEDSTEVEKKDGTCQKGGTVMTSAQVEYLKMLETQRHNQATEQQEQANLAEQGRHNKQTEGSAWLNAGSNTAKAAGLGGILTLIGGKAGARIANAAKLRSYRVAHGAAPVASKVASGAKAAAEGIKTAAAAHPVATAVTAGVAAAGAVVAIKEKQLREMQRILEEEGVSLDEYNAKTDYATKHRDAEQLGTFRTKVKQRIKAGKYVTKEVQTNE